MLASFYRRLTYLLAFSLKYKRNQQNIFIVSMNSRLGGDKGLIIACKPAKVGHSRLSNRHIATFKYVSPVEA